MSGEIVLRAPNDRLLEQVNGYAPDGVEIPWVDSTRPMDEQVAQMKDAVAVIAFPSDFPLELAKQCPNVRLVQVPSAGTDRIDKLALGEMGIKVANNGGGNAVAVAELTISLMVAVYRKLQLQLASVKARQWAGDIRDNWFSQTHELTDKRVGIIGLGRIGQEVARRLSGWGCTIVYDDVVRFPVEVEEELKVSRVSRDELLRTSDIVTLHVPLTKEARGMMSDREFDMMKPTALLINACRGSVVDEAALIRAMEASKIAGAGLDVLEQEPTPADNPLLDMDTVVVTPHMAGWSQEGWARSLAFNVQNAVRVVNGGEPESVVLPE